MEATLTRAAEIPRAATAGIEAREFEEIVCRNQRRIYRLLLTILRDPDAADTLTQECFLRAYRKRASFRGESSVETWLVRIAVNLARDHVKSRRQAFWKRLFSTGGAEEAVTLEVPDARASPERALLAREEMAAVWSVVDELSPQQRTIFLMRFVEEMTLEEIAQAMELEVGTVKSHLHRGVGAVRRRLKEQRI